MDNNKQKNKFNKKQRKLVNRYDDYQIYSTSDNLMGTCAAFFCFLVFVLLSIVSHKIIIFSILTACIAIFSMICCIIFIRNTFDKLNHTPLKKIAVENNNIFLKHKKNILDILNSIGTPEDEKITLVNELIENTFLPVFKKELFTMKAFGLNILIKTYRIENNYILTVNKKEKYNIANVQDLLEIYDILVQQEDFKINNSLETKDKYKYLSENKNYMFKLINQSNKNVNEKDKKLICLYNKIKDQLTKTIITYINQENNSTITEETISEKKKNKLIIMAEQLLNER